MNKASVVVLVSLLAVGLAVVLLARPGPHESVRLVTLPMANTVPPNPALALLNSPTSPATLAAPRPSCQTFVQRPLVTASPEEVAQAALDYTCTHFRVLSGAPEVALIRRVVPEDIAALDLPAPAYHSSDPPLMMLVILKGDFDVSNMPGIRPAVAPAEMRATYLGYVFNLRTGFPSLTLTSPRGGLFRRALNDPTLLDDAPRVTPLPSSAFIGTVKPPPTNAVPATPWPQGAVIPGLPAPPGRPLPTALGTYPVVVVTRIAPGFTPGAVNTLAPYPAPSVLP